MLLHVQLTQTGSFHFQDLGATCKAKKSGQLPHWASTGLPTQESIEGCK